MVDYNEVEENMDAQEALEREFITQEEIDKAKETQPHGGRSSFEDIEGAVPSEQELRFVRKSPGRQKLETFAGEVYRGDEGSKGAKFKEGAKKGVSKLWKGAKVVAGVTGQILKKGAEVTIPAVAGSYQRVRQEQAERRAAMEARREEGGERRKGNMSFFEIAQQTRQGAGGFGKQESGTNFAKPKAGWPSFTEMAEQVKQRNAQAMAERKAAPGRAAPQGAGLIVASAGWPSFIEMGRTHQAQTKSGWFNEPVNHGLAAKGIKVRGRKGKRGRR